MSNRIVLASGNRGKLEEFNQILAPLNFSAVPQHDFSVRDVEETGLSFVENAILKARNACRATGLPSLADDSGLEVDALRGAPGIYSARYAGEGASDEENNRKLLAALADVPDSERTARFQCVLVFMRHAEDPTPLICQGTWEGSILREPQGQNGFGYDPLFLVPELGCASAELTPEQKHERSHRGKAVRQLIASIAPYLAQV
ncbi:RdgB/HAM1 family non-canonical purine NTP pyrophosphatase [Marinobacterium mangrovicola]|uniref:dITP/XTP pyrophosphatase n=1 Tax=Marinobacterium mangrovicola TaxID=1476959 RepID=A0A4R1H7R5_9GAMM|nr:RdgB/HAM1 family non-canonical purine NTP pyrophosphatase [Marinobacterium mangrovicola]TCK16511.1 XTP/dITP diphosphohydrolase [Marinobacterium mangrovicola]